MSHRLSILPTVAPAPRNNENAPPQHKAMAGRKSFGTAFSRTAAVGANGSVPVGPLLASAPALSNLYSTVVKLSAENKINAQNTWALPLIDHMETLLELDCKPQQAKPAANNAATSAPSNTKQTKGKEANAVPDQAMLNFQRASCALDASIKIYAARVDDTYTTSFRVLDSLSRSGKQEQTSKDSSDDVSPEGAADGDEDSEEGPVKKVSKSKKHTDNAASATIEKNVSSITLSVLEHAFQIDPLYHKLSSSYDESGICGLLLNRLHVSAGTNIAFDSSETVDIDSCAGSGYALHVPTSSSLKKLLPGASLSCECAEPLAPFYTDLEKHAATLKMAAFAPLAAAVKAATEEYKAARAAAGTPPRAAAMVAPAFVDDDDEDDSAPVDFAAMLEATEAPALPASSSPTSHAPGYERGAGDVDGFDAAYDDYQNDHSQNATTPANNMMPSTASQSIPLDLELLSAAVTQAHKPLSVAVNAMKTSLHGAAGGSTHWKLAKSKQTSTAAATKATKKKRVVKAKTPVILDFTEKVSETRAELFVRAKKLKSKADKDSEQLSGATLDKWAAAGSSVHCIPAALWSCDVRGLSLRPNLLTNPNGLPQILKEITTLSTLPLHIHASFTTTAAAVSSSAEGYTAGGDDDDGEEDGGAYYEQMMFGDVEYDKRVYDDSVAVAPAAVPAEGDDASPGGPVELVAAARKVERIRVKYDTVAKKVDVRQLKENMWDLVAQRDIPTQKHTELEKACRTAASTVRFDDASQAGAAIGAGKADCSSDASFMGMVKHMSASMPAAVTIPFYFITVLHLANEHNLSLRREGEGGDGCNGFPLGDFSLAHLQ